MSIQQIKKLEALQEKRRALQEEEDKIKAVLLGDLSSWLIKADALAVEFDILIGGILDVIEKYKKGDKITEAWKTSGQKFCQRHKKKGSPKEPLASKASQENQGGEA